jgi:hypothetical protein
MASGRCLSVFEGGRGFVASATITPDGLRLLSADGRPQVSFWDLASGGLLGTLRLLDRGVLWTTPPDEAAGAPSGWLWTDRPDLVHLTEANKHGSGDPRPIPRDSEQFKDYMRAYNCQEIVMARINDPQRYRELTGRIKPLLERDKQDAARRHKALPGPDSGTVPQAPPSDDQ